MPTYSNLRRTPSQLIEIYRKRPVFRMYVTLSLTLLTITFFALFAIRPTAVTIFDLIAELNTKKALTATLDSKISAIFAAQSVYADVTPRLGILDAAVPETPSLSGFVQQVQLLAGVRQVTLRSLSFEQYNLLGGPVPGPKTNKKQASGEFLTTPYPFTLAVVGPYSNLYGFLSDLESLRRIVTISAFAISQGQSETGGTTLTLTVKGNVTSLSNNANQQQ